MIKTRFCPSPTGLLHLGNLRTALFALLFAKNHSGVFLLRIEDTDKTRSNERYTQMLQEDLKWLGMNWDEGPEHDKGLGPYWQSQRQEIYDGYYQVLQDKGFAYPCFCSEEQLALTRKIQRASNKPPRYSGVCKQLTKEEVVQKIEHGLKPTLRFAVPQDEVTEFKDVVRGEQRFENNDIGDFIIRRADGTSPFMFCNAVDDSLMEVTHVLRGEDHITNTPRQLMILQALGLKAPHYGHISLITGSDGAPLSKRNGSQSAQDLKAQVYLPEAVINYLARLGHYYSEDHWMTMDELASKFQIGSLSFSPARFDVHQLRYWQGEAVTKMNNDQVWTWMGEAVQEIVPSEQQQRFIETIRPNITFPRDALHWAETFYSESLAFNEEGEHILTEAGDLYLTTLLDAIKEEGADYQAVLAILKSSLNLKGKALFAPLRIILTGALQGPELANIFELLGPEGLKKRVEAVLR